MPFSDSKNNTTSSLISTIILIINILGILIFGGIILYSLTHKPWMRYAFTYFSYYIVFALSVAWVLSLINLQQNNGFRLIPFLRLHWKGLLISFLLTSIVFISVSKYFRVLSDETNLLSVSKSMTFYKHVLNITEGRWYYEMYWPTYTKGIEKRPFLFPFFTSVMHNILGYHVENAFILNYFVLWGALFLLYLLIRFYLSELWAFAGLILVVAQPVISLSAASASFEIFNLLFLLISFLSLRHFLYSPNSRSFLLLTLSLIMISNIRYEAIVYFAGIMLILLFTGSIKGRFFKDSAWFALTPLFFLSLIWQRILMLNESDSNLTGGSWIQAFSFKHAVDNIALFFKYIFSLNGQLGYSGFINMVGFLALFYCIILILIRLKNLTDENQKIFLTCLFASIFAVFCVILLYQGGINDHPMNGRMYIPVLVILSVLPLFAFAHLFSKMNWSATPILIGAMVAFIFYHPIAIEDRLTNYLMIIREYRFVDSFLKKHADKNSLVVCGRPGQLIVSNYGAMYYSTANRDVGKILHEYSNHLYSTIYVIQSISYATLSPLPDNVIDARYKLETVEELQILGSYFYRISRVKTPE